MICFYLAKRYMGEISINLKVDFHYTKIFQILPSWGGKASRCKKGSETINLNKVSEGFLELPKLLIFWISEICQVAKRYMDYVYVAKRYMILCYLAKRYKWQVSINLKVDFHYTNIFLLSKTLHDLFLISKTLHVGSFY